MKSVFLTFATLVVLAWPMEVQAQGCSGGFSAPSSFGWGGPRFDLGLRTRNFGLDVRAGNPWSPPPWGWRGQWSAPPSWDWGGPPWGGYQPITPLEFDSPFGGAATTGYGGGNGYGQPIYLGSYTVPDDGYGRPDLRFAPQQFSRPTWGGYGGGGFPSTGGFGGYRTPG